MVRPDGQLSHDLLPGEKGPQDACGVFGVWAPGEEVAKLAYYGLYALQHRGQESAGIAASDGNRIAVYKDMGLVSQVFDEATLTTLTGHLAVGHCRYSTTGGSHWANAQPTLGATPHGTVALAHNGNLTNSAELYEKLIDKSGFPSQGEMAQGNTTDTALVTALLAEHPHGSLEDAAMHLLPQLVGSFCLAFMDENALYAARDPQGIRPLVLGRLERGWVVASETAALDIVGASLVREIEPGEFVVIDEHGLRSQRFAETRRAACVFEYVYLARPDTTINGRSVYESRVEMGRRLAREHRIDADLVMPTPESGTPAAIGYAEESGIPFGNGLVKNAYVGRTFIQPSDTIRQLGIRLKLNPLKSVVAGKRLVVIDDSIVRGNTQRALIRMLREAGAAEIHVRISSPPIKWPCFYGIDFASRAELIANGLGVEEIRASLGADSLGYISEDGMIAATLQERGELCTACFSGTYPTRLPDADKLGKNVFEARTPVDSSPRRAPGGSAVAQRPEHASAVSIDTRPSATDGLSRRPAERTSISDEDPGVQETSTGCDPGPDADLEDLILPEDRVPAARTTTGPAGPGSQHAAQPETAKDA
ncbi:MULTISPECIES: amidophosphoribosyltransferase [Kocuria]|uniref:amidophosphoribosyltransferase n=1 Tax=Kocuria TaxID=57493 RepID=UPI000BAB569F|nr:MULTISPECIES: amidophosphoribosyltransferase [Kocuria]PAU91741.1 amidophosphoribosyltransferase [Kocuria sp. WN036]PWF82971.1 amidophosphoribosyltransferase [Kocuria rosea]THE18707.1 amidophosphoribosyltransferase [Kocuria rosea]WIG18075.1 amidophosphoribosyltransferase [Kocuria rosea]WJZ67444.1 amidophosphoribosyltransferase [Kocuria rosea]